MSRLLLLLNPTLEILLRLYVHTQQHLGVLGSAILGALAEVESRFVRVDPHIIGVIGDQVGLTREARNPEAVIGIGREQLDVASESGARDR